ncbi:uncharacterized protein EI97DRAFT_454893 [Westerdykella ornata]|uniref:Uncharacterized protein n=1 Tax=Westerdykella ornata TaxID=318751 RepID=A0A6A6JTL3_WESOR|nr:uncharacterized protein EI97DRAFT_454893 [Westerdykella ornata]KAF2279951.1 hypothetical protein EI97DRAFT_454893 [Westerdykella ornata]
MKLTGFEQLSKKAQAAEIKRISKEKRISVPCSGTKAELKQKYKELLEKYEELKDEEPIVATSETTTLSESWTRISTRKGHPVSTIASKCLEVLGCRIYHPVADEPEDTEVEDARTAHLQPILTAITRICKFIECMPPTSDAALNLTVLRNEVTVNINEGQLETGDAPLSGLDELLKAMDFTGEGAERVPGQTEETVPSDVPLLKSDMDTIRCCLNERLMNWVSSFPAASVEEAQWPKDFSEKEKDAIRAYCREKMDEYPGPWDAWDAAQPEAELLAFIKAIMGDEGFPAAAERTRSVLTLRNIISNLRQEFKSQSVKQLAGKKRAGKAQGKKGKKRKSDEGVVGSSGGESEAEYVLEDESDEE